MKKANTRKIPHEIREGYLTALTEKVSDDLYGCLIHLNKEYVLMGRMAKVTSVTVTNKGSVVKLTDVMSDETINITL